jgi:hypothetical protein
MRKMAARGGRWVLTVAAAMALLAMTVSGASATSVLLFDDFSFNPPPAADPADPGSRWPTALMGLGLSVTQVGDDAAFNAAIGNGWDLVVIQFDLFSHSIEPGLADYIAGGGKVIFGSSDSTSDADFEVQEAGVDLLTLDLTSLFSAGLSGMTLLLDPGSYGIWSRSFLADAGTVVAGTFEDLNAAIVVGNSGRTIINGFMGDTLSEADEIRLYQNEVRYLVAAAVPQPRTGILLAVGGLVLVVVRHRQKKNA